MATYSVTVETTFSAIHRVSLPDGSLEPFHGHDWLVRATFVRSDLDENGMVVDFVEVKNELDRIAGGLNHQDLNENVAFKERQPTAENVARYFFDVLVSNAFTCTRRIEITEAPGCVAAYEA